MYIDTHAHIYSDDFDDDRDMMISNALQAGVEKIVLPNIDEGSIDKMIRLSKQYPGICFPLMGLHPTSVTENYKDQLDAIECLFTKYKFYGVGETGIDLYWDTSKTEEQKDAFRIQLRWAKHLKIPVVIHVRNSFDEVFSVLSHEQDGTLRGVFHCFAGNISEARKITDIGFLLGIGGVVTFKNSRLHETLSQIAIDNIVLETDSPYLAPMPHRGRRNECAYLVYIAQKLSEIYGIKPNKVGEITTHNARILFGI